MRKRLQLIFKGGCILFLAATTLVFVKPIEAASAIVSISGPSQVSTGQTFTININIDTAGASVAGAQFTLSFDSSLLVANSVSSGVFLSSKGATVFFLPGTIGEGLVNGVAIAITTPQKTVSGSGVLAQINFTALAKTGISSLSLSKVVVGDINGASVNATISNGQISISTKTELTVIGVSALDKTYDGTPSASLSLGKASLVGVKTGDAVTLNTSSAIGTFSDKNVGIGKTVTVSGLTLGGTNAENYTLIQPTTIANITKTSLIVKANDQSINVGDKDPTFTISYSGFVNGEAASILDTPPLAKVDVIHSSAGTYPILVTGGNDEHYAFNYANGTLIVNPPVVSNGGGGGGGGGFGSQLVGIGLSGISPFMDGNGKAITSGQIDTPDGKLDLDIPVGTYVWNEAGAAQAFISASVYTNPPQPPVQSVLIQAYDMGPNGVTFNPPISMTMSYSNDEVPLGVDQSALYIAWWDGTNWVKLDSHVNVALNTVSAGVSHFTCFALFAPDAIVDSNPKGSETTNSPEVPLPTLTTNSVKIKVTPVYMVSEELSLIQIGYEFLDVLPDQNQARVNLVVNLNGEIFDKCSYQIDLGPTHGVIEYGPTNGWLSGSYDFDIVLSYGGSEYSDLSKVDVLSGIPSQTLPTANNIISWHLLGQLICGGLALGVLVSVVVLFKFRRTNVHL